MFPDFYLPNILYSNIKNTKILQTIPPQNRYNFKPSYLKKLFLLSSSSWTFCFITLVIVSDCFPRAFVAFCTASIFACNAFLTSWIVISLTSSLRLPISADMAFRSSSLLFSNCSTCFISELMSCLLSSASLCLFCSALACP